MRHDLARHEEDVVRVGELGLIHIGVVLASQLRVSDDLKLTYPSTTDPL